MSRASRSPPPIDRSRRSPNYGPRRPVDGRIGVRHLVLHYTGMADGTAALDRLCDPAAAVSAHYLIEEDGRVFALVAEDVRAWHAGRSFWRGVYDVNSTSVGIELVNPGHDLGYRPFPAAQIDALIALAGDIVARHGIAPLDVVGHSDIAPGRKRDPGELFPWNSLAAAGIGLWPAVPGPALEAPWPALSAIGYAVPEGPGTDILAADGAAVVAAFQMRFRPARADGVLDAETLGLIAAVAAAYQSTA
jgi:N-acetylmuramoyl-L-alanine amidase